MKKLAFALVLFCGCNEIVPVPSETPITVTSGVYSFSEVGRSQFNLEGSPIIVVIIKNNETGKSYLISYHDGSQAESQIKLGEWIEPKKD